MTIPQKGRTDKDMHAMGIALTAEHREILVEHGPYTLSSEGTLFDGNGVAIGSFRPHPTSEETEWDRAALAALNEVAATQCGQCRGSGLVEEDAVGALGYLVKRACPNGCKVPTQPKADRYLVPPPGGLTKAEYVALALACLDQANVTPDSLAEAWDAATQRPRPGEDPFVVTLQALDFETPDRALDVTAIVRAT